MKVPNIFILLNDLWHVQHWVTTCEIRVSATHWKILYQHSTLLTNSMWFANVRKQFYLVESYPFRVHEHTHIYRHLAHTHKNFAWFHSARGNTCHTQRITFFHPHLNSFNYNWQIITTVYTVALFFVLLVPTNDYTIWNSTIWYIQFDIKRIPLSI